MNLLNLEQLMKFPLYSAFTFFLVVICLPQASAQLYMKFLGHRSDTIYPKLINAGEKEKMHVFNELAFYYSIYLPDSAIGYAEKSLQLAEKFDSEYEKASAYRNLGNAFALKGDYSQAIFYLQKALKIFEDLKLQRKIFELNFDLAKLNYDMEEYEQSIFYTKITEQLMEQEEAAGNSIATPYEKALAMGMTAVVWRESKNYAEAIRCFKTYRKLSKSLEIPDVIHGAFIKSLGETYYLADEYDSALKYTYEAQTFFKENKNKPPREHTGYESSIGILWLKKGNPDTAIFFLRQSLNNNKRNGSLYYTSSDAIQLGDAFRSKKMYDSARYYYRDALGYASKLYQQLMQEKTDASQQVVYSGYQAFFEISQAEAMQNYYGLIQRIYRRIYKLYKATGEAMPALENHELMAAYRDSFNVITDNIDEKKLQARFQTERYEQQLALLEKDNILKQSQIRNNRLILFVTAVILLFILVVVILFFRQHRLRSAQDKLQLEQRLLRSQMNPHFIFNSLASIQNFIVKQDDTKASIYLARFSGLVRSILYNSMLEQITLEEELKTIENYLELQRIRFPEKFDYCIKVDERLDIESIFLPPMLSQPFIENAIEHGIKTKGTKGQIKVEFKKQDGSLVLGIEDDGIGRQMAREILLKRDKEHKSLATHITRERIRILNKKLSQRISLNIIDLKNEMAEAAGTKVVFRIPV